MTGRRRIGRREDNKIFDLPEDNDLLGSFEKALEDMEMTEKNKPAWVIDEEELNEQKMLQMYKTRNYKMKSPLEEDSECARQQEKILKKAENYRFSNPLMEEPAQVKRQIYAQKEKAQNYKFDNIFEAPPMSEKEKKKIAEYKMNPPFNSGYNYTEEPVKTAKKIAPGRQQTTRRPWEYGALPGEPPAAKPATCKPTKTTGFWPKPEATNEDLGIESSGDPILDSLRLQLKKHGASGITGLGRKFRIMDDDGSGCLCLDEFRKGMKELKLAELSDKAICHLFRYFGKIQTIVIVCIVRITAEKQIYYGNSSQF